MGRQKSSSQGQLHPCVGSQMATWVIEGSCPALWFKIMGAGMQEWYQRGVEWSYWGRLTSEAFVRPRQKSGTRLGTAETPEIHPENWKPWWRSCWKPEVCGLSMQVRDRTKQSWLSLWKVLCVPSVSPVVRGQSWARCRVQSGPIWHSVLLYTGWKDLMFCGSFIHVSYLFLPTWYQVLQGFHSEHEALTFQELTAEQKGMVS